MSAIDHSMMFKSRSGRHFGKINNDEEKEKKKRNRHNKRHTAFSKNRIIQSTPGKIKVEEVGKLSNASMVKQQNAEQNKNSSRQKAFRDRFKQYLDTKANLKQTKPTLKPCFTSTVPKGRFIDQITEKKKEISRENPHKIIENGRINIKYKPSDCNIKPPLKVTTKKNFCKGDPKTKTSSNQNYSELITSTVVRPKKCSTKSAKMFNESISPVEGISQVILSPAENETSFRTPENENSINYVSPFVTISRGGRTSNRKEKEARTIKYNLPSRRSNDLNQSIEDRQKNEAACYFRLQVQREKNHLEELSTYWRAYADEHEIPSEYVDLVNVAVGQTKLLTTSKFEQFLNLIGQYESSKIEPVIKTEDLEGFWSMVHLQVDYCNQRFDRLKILRNNDWSDPDIQKEKKIRISKTSMVSKNKASKKRVNSAVSMMLKEARKNLGKEGTKENNPLIRCVTPRKNTWVVENCSDNDQLPAKRGILKTPGSVRKKRMTLTFKTSPEINIIQSTPTSN